jgi:hypothetical protein
MASHDPDGPMAILFKTVADIGPGEELTIRYV